MNSLWAFTRKSISFRSQFNLFRLVPQCSHFVAHLLHHRRSLFVCNSRTSHDSKNGPDFTFFPSFLSPIRETRSAAVPVVSDSQWSQRKSLLPTTSSSHFHVSTTIPRGWKTRIEHNTHNHQEQNTISRISRTAQHQDRAPKQAVSTQNRA